MEGSSPNPVRILAFCGSLRRNSYNRLALNAARELLPDGMTLEEFDIAPVPSYNEDVRQDGFPPVVERMREAIRRADALLFVSPEYNYSMPGVLKNGIDWASRPPDQPFAGKPAAIMGASQSFTGTARMQYHLRQTLVFLDVHPVNRPEVLIGEAQKRFDPEGRLTDDTTRRLIRELLVSLREHTRRMTAPPTARAAKR